MYFDFEDLRPDISPVGRAISWREGVLLSVVAHLAGIIVILMSPDIFPQEPREVAALNVTPAPPTDTPRFVFVEPRVDTPAPAPRPRAELSDENRVASSPEPAETPDNPLPRMRGNTSERVERMEREAARGVEEPPRPPEPENETTRPESQSPLTVPAPQQRPAPRIAGGSLGESLRNLERYIQEDQFDNPRGGNTSFGPFIQFDTKGVDFGRWIARFKRQVEGNWLIPLAASMNRGHVVITFNVHRNGNITDLQVVKPSGVPSFNNSSYGALSASNPTVPLPPEYPLDKAFFTVTFFYNEEPPR